MTAPDRSQAREGLKSEPEKAREKLATAFMLFGFFPREEGVLRNIVNKEARVNVSRVKRKTKRKT